jgi:hypothetical protein
MKRVYLMDGHLPVYLPFGMTVKQFANAQQSFTEFARDRIVKGGAAAYDLGTHQKMEALPPAQLITELREELADAINYIAGLDIQLQRLADRLSGITEA